MLERVTQLTRTRKSVVREDNDVTLL